MSKLTMTLSALALIGWGLAAYLFTRPAPAPQVSTVERIQYVDRIVNRDVVKEVKKPDGTTIVTRTVEKEVQAKSEKVSAATTVQALPKYQVGVGVQLGRELLMNQPIYSFEVGARLGDSPLWIKSQLTTDREVYVTLTYEF